MMKAQDGASGVGAGGASGIARIMAVLIAIYAISQFLRNSIGVIAPDLAAELDMDARTLGLLSSGYFLAFAAAQIPVGIAIDRYGARTTLLVSLVITVIAIALFASAPDSTTLILARFLLGIGCSSFFMAPLALYARRFPAERFAALTSIQLGVGSIGALFATAPLAMSAAAIGWRGSFAALGLVTALLAVALLLFVPRREARESPHENWAETFRGVADATRVRSFWSVFVMHAATYSAFASVIGLWAGPWLADSHGADLQTRGNILLLAATAHIGGVFAWGAADRLFRSYKRSCLFGGGLLVSLLAYAALVPMDLRGASIWLILLGLCVAYTPIVTSHGKSLFPPALTGRGITLMNMGTMGGVFLSQTATGFVVAAFAGDAAGYPDEAYRAVFALLALVLATGLAIYARAIDPHPLRHAPPA